MWRAAALAALAALPAPAQERLGGHGGPVMAIDVGRDGRIATASFDNSVGIWTGGEPRWLDGHRAAVNDVIFLPGGGLASSGDDFAVIVWADGTPDRREGHEGKVMALASGPDGTLASASWDGTVGIWPAAGPPRFLRGHGAPVNDVAYGPGGQLYSAGADGTVRVWDSGADRVLVSHGFGVNRIAFGANWLAYGTVDGATRLVDPATGAVVADYSAERRPVLALAVHGDLLAVGDGEGHVMVVDTAAGTVRHDFRAVRQGPVWALAWSRDGGTLLGAGLDPVVYAWPVAAMDDVAPAGPALRAFQADPETMTNGERQFQRKCAICHTLTPDGERRAGPSLHGLFGRPAGSVAGYDYSATLTGSRIVWTSETIDALFDEGPDHYVPGSKMPMQRITGSGDRADLVAFLRRATEETE